MTRAFVNSSDYDDEKSDGLRSSSNSAVLKGFYVLHDELGCGGFGRVKLATHLLTGQKVAIKIIEKKTLGNDLRRVTNELEALRKLSHQNICRLYQHIENDEKLFIVMEFCSGGEMFDYIVKKERLQESEARYFFRQLVQAIAYVHDMGFAHRDLKPENLLLTEDLQLKLIDFGLCAHPKTLNRPLDTFCGSPAYAAPELIQGKEYLGHEADIWSMGVLLYALLCGTLPFEDNNMQILYRKISSGIYVEPSFLSESSKELLRSMLQVNPKRRISIKQLIEHKWINMNYFQALKWQSIYDPNIVDADVTKEIATYFCREHTEMEKILKQWRFDYITATYFLLLGMKKRGLKYALPIRRLSYKDDRMIQNILASPTIHASLGCDLDLSGLDAEDDYYNNANDKHNEPLLRKIIERNENIGKKLLYKPLLTFIRNEKTRTSFVHTTYEPPHRGYNIHRGGDIQIPNYPAFVTPIRKHGEPFVYNEERTRTGVYVTPVKRLGESRFVTPKSRKETPFECRIKQTPPFEPFEGRIPRPVFKTPRLQQRVFASLERQADKMINLLTPRKVKNNNPGILKHTKTMVNISITSSKNPDLVRRELVKALANEHLSVEQQGWKLMGKKRNKYGRSMTVELEIVLIEMGNHETLVGVKRRRLSGDSFLYKKVCEEILRLAGL
uniref:non-specific serine/threonine protein kinase n=1 Tax=Syphacia muris TaxID=451379 RepID=A0A0N5AFM7_9BILA